MSAAGTDPPPSSPPERIGKYPVISKLGEGATSEVYLCRDPFNDREVAVKRIFPEALRDSSRGGVYRKLFLAEASLAGKLSHPHIAAIYDAVVEDDSGYIVMEYVAGGTLESRTTPDNLLPIDKVVEIVFKCTRALSYANQLGVTHRDIKPGNILMSGPADIKISDFGLALSAGADATHVTGVGSPAYMSPEQIREQPLSQQTDIYSLGVVMYQLLTGQLPYQASNNFSMIYQITTTEPVPPSSLREGIPMSVDRIVRKAMQKDQARRYQTWEDFAKDLAEAFRADGLANKREEFADSEKFNALRAMHFFRRFSDPELWEVVAIGHWEKVPAGRTLMREGETGEHFCMLVSGEVKVTKNKKLLNVLGAGECFGEMAYLADTANVRGASVSANSESHIVRINVADLANATEACRLKFERAFIGILVERLNLANTRLTSS
jgi:tRNA A-37 threonylcarbamoyl transferase component Bud32